MLTVTVPAAPGETALPREQRLRRFLNAYWLRPENAMWMAMRSEVLSSVALAGPGADLCCGDGLFSFLHAGGVLDPSFDVFTHGVNANAGKESAPDMFDHVSDQYRPGIVRPPLTRMEVGCDWKENLLAKARRLDFYSRTVRHNANEPLPFPDAAFASLYCNSAYWIENIDGFLGEIARVLQPGGRAVLHVKLDSMRDCTLERFEGALGRKFLDAIAGDRLRCWPTLASPWPRMPTAPCG